MDPEFRLAGSGEGALVGSTFAVKDLYDIAGRVTGAGNPDWRRTHAPASLTATAVETLRTAGATLTGITHTDELAFSLNGCNHHYGTPINPAAPERIPGGSSSGSAVAVAGGLVDFALGTDTGGSVRVPASHCGIWGIRTTHGRIDKGGLVPLAPSFDTIGWFARSPALLAAVGEVLLSADSEVTPAASGFFVAEDCLAEADPAVRAAFEACVATLAATVGPIERAPLLPLSVDAAFDANRVLMVAEAAHTHRAWIEATRPTFGPGVAERFAAALARSDDDVPAATERRAAIAAHLRRLLAGGRVALLPTVPAPPPRRDAAVADLEAYRFRAQRLTAPAGLAGAPQISVPALAVDGVPIALGLLAAPGADRLLLATAARVAAALSLTPFTDTHPRLDRSPR
ncbi:amidase [Siculibacillus lacustris]|uniref:amidase n=1 Tax=Siculibacillus lacustris TaxID=1549641 RepID=UPI002248E749|nr:amidase [Siculibacillus lacustris]